MKWQVARLLKTGSGHSPLQSDYPIPVTRGRGRQSAMPQRLEGCIARVWCTWPQISAGPSCLLWITGILDCWRAIAPCIATCTRHPIGQNANGLDTCSTVSSKLTSWNIPLDLGDGKTLGESCQAWRFESFCYAGLIRAWGLRPSSKEARAQVSDTISTLNIRF